MRISVDIDGLVGAIEARIREQAGTRRGHFETDDGRRFRIARAIQCPKCGTGKGRYCRTSDIGGSMCQQRMPLGPDRWLQELGYGRVGFSFIEDLVPLIRAVLVEELGR